MGKQKNQKIKINNCKNAFESEEHFEKIQNFCDSSNEWENTLGKMKRKKTHMAIKIQ